MAGVEPLAFIGCPCGEGAKRIRGHLAGQVTKPPPPIALVLLPRLPLPRGRAGGGMGEEAGTPETLRRGRSTHRVRVSAPPRHQEGRERPPPKSSVSMLRGRTAGICEAGRARRSPPAPMGRLRGGDSPLSPRRPRVPRPRQLGKLDAPQKQRDLRARGTRPSITGPRPGGRPPLSCLPGRP